MFLTLGSGGNFIPPPFLNLTALYIMGMMYILWSVAISIIPPGYWKAFISFIEACTVDHLAGSISRFKKTKAWSSSLYTRRVLQSIIVIKRVQIKWPREEVTVHWSHGDECIVLRLVNQECESRNTAWELEGYRIAFRENGGPEPAGAIATLWASFLKAVLTCF